MLKKNQLCDVNKIIDYLIFRFDFMWTFHMLKINYITYYII